MKRLHTYAATAALAGALVLTGCGSGVSHGKIMSKQYVPEKDWTYMQPMYTTHCNTVNKTTSCSQTLTGFIPIPETDPECWRLNLSKDGHTGHVCVSQHSWETAIIGTDW